MLKTRLNKLDAVTVSVFLSFRILLIDLRSFALVRPSSKLVLAAFGKTCQVRRSGRSVATEKSGGLSSWTLLGARIGCY